MTTEPTNPRKLAQDALELASKATPGPWKWNHDFQIGRKIHWSLDNPERPDGGVGDGIRRCIDYYLVTFTDQDHYCEDDPSELTEQEQLEGKTWATRSLDTRPDFKFIAQSRKLVPDLAKALIAALDRNEHLEKELAEFKADDALWWNNYHE